MASVGINPPKTPVTKGSNGVAAATVPNVCKMPGPPAPFVPTPLPNIGKSGMSPKDFSTTVKIEGNVVAIRGASFGSMGDVASKGLGGGIVSMNCEGPTKFIAPGSLNVQIEGKNVHLLSDVMSNNNGPSGSPPNAATMAGLLQAIGSPATPDSSKLVCGEVGEYGTQKNRTGDNKYHRDHIPSKAALKEKARELNGGIDLTAAQEAAIENLALSIVIPAGAHREVSPTYGGRNSPDLISGDSDDLAAAAERDTKDMEAKIKDYPDADAACIKAYKAAAKKIRKLTNKDYEKFLNECLKAK